MSKPLDKLFDSKNTPPPPLPPEAAAEESIAFDDLIRDDVTFSGVADDEPVHADEGDGPAPEALTMRARRIAAEIEEMVATAEAEAVAAAVAPLERTIAQLHADLDARSGELGRFQTENQALRAKLERITAALAA